MNINLTLFLQMISFAVFVWFCMKFVWPPIVAALAERKTKITEGLAAAERGHQEQNLGQQRAKELMVEAKKQAADIVAQAQKRALEIVEEAKGGARAEGEREMDNLGISDTQALLNPVASEAQLAFRKVGCK